MNTPFSPKRVLVMVAHADDAELTCAGTLVSMIRLGAQVTLLVATDGARGGKHVGVDVRAISDVRRAEQQEAARRLGVATVVALPFADGELRNDGLLRGALVEQIRRVRPDLAIIMDPQTLIYRDVYVNHTDHRELGMAALDAMYPLASNAGYYPEQLDEGLELHKVPECWLAQTEHPNHWMDVSESLDTRFDALRAHRSQVSLWPEQGEAVIRQYREWASVAGVRHGVRYAEEFRRVVVNPLT